MSLIGALRSVRNTLLTPEESEQRKDLLFMARTVKVLAVLEGAVMSIIALRSLAQGNLSVSLLPAYLDYEIWTIANNVEESLENPIKEVRLNLAKCKSNEAYVRMIAKGAPLTSEILAFIARKSEKA